MKSLRLRAILKTLGYKPYFKGNNGTVYYNFKLDNMVYLDLELETYLFNIKNKGYNYARRELMYYITRNNREEELWLTLKETL